ncbi:MAG: phytanoyl-CoA dioxygenase family protein, partial [Acidimicrobiales bacterium]
VLHLPNTTVPDEIVEVIRRDGCVVVDELVSPEMIDDLLDEMGPYVEANEVGPDDFTGRNTKRTGGLVARSATARELVTKPLVLGTVKAFLAQATNFQLHLTQLISIGPDSPAQAIHRDQWAFDFFPFPKGYEVQCNTLWAATDFTEQNGATRVIVGSNHDDDGLQFTPADSEPAEMAKGSVLFYSGSIYHGGGANRSDRTRVGINITYNVAWLRQEENQYLSVPPEIAGGLDDDLLRLLGYDKGAYALGYVDDMRDPLAVLRSDPAATGMGDLAKTRAQAERLRQESS